MTRAEKTAEALRSIDDLAAKARRSLDYDEDRKIACAHLVTIQMKAQAALRDTLTDNTGE